MAIMTFCYRDYFGIRWKRREGMEIKCEVEGTLFSPGSKKSVAVQVWYISLGRTHDKHWWNQGWVHLHNLWVHLGRHAGSGWHIRGAGTTARVPNTQEMALQSSLKGQWDGSLVCFPTIICITWNILATHLFSSCKEHLKRNFTFCSIHVMKTCLRPILFCSEWKILAFCESVDYFQIRLRFLLWLIWMA